MEVKLSRIGACLRKGVAKALFWQLRNIISTSRHRRYRFQCLRFVCHFAVGLSIIEAGRGPEERDTEMHVPLEHSCFDQLVWHTKLHESSMPAVCFLTFYQSAIDNAIRSCRLKRHCPLVTSCSSGALHIQHGQEAEDGGRGSLGSWA